MASRAPQDKYDNSVLPGMISNGAFQQFKAVPMSLLTVIVANNTMLLRLDD